MCCFAQPVHSVANTKIFARLSGNGTQFLTYRMDYESATPNAMILPIPIALPSDENSVRFLSLKDYPQFFDDLDRGFPSVERQSHFLPMARVATDSMDAKLIVHEVGDFIASFVPSIDDFHRLDPQFVIPRESWEKVPGYQDFGFAVFQLKSLAGSIHPIAFEFDTRWTDRIFFPTVHIHDGEVHSAEHFDHMLYLQSPSWDRSVGRYRGPESRDHATHCVRSKQQARHFCNFGASQGIIAPSQYVHRHRMLGNLANTDTLFDDSIAGTASVGSWLNKTTIGGSLIAGGLSWLIYRRMKLRA